VVSCDKVCISGEEVVEECLVNGVLNGFVCVVLQWFYCSNAAFTTTRKVGNPQWEITETPTSNECQNARKVGKSAVASKSEKSEINISPEFPSGKSPVPTFQAVKNVYSHWELGISDFPSGSECSIIG